MINQLFHIIEDPDRILIVGTGNALRKDDGIGIYAAKQLREKSEYQVLIAENGLENHTGKINRLQPDKLIIIDAVNLNMKPGSFKLLPLFEIRDFTGNTHTISFTKLAEMLIVSEIYILGIQPADLSIGTDITEKVLHSADLIVQQFLTIYSLKHKTKSYEEEF